ncbi:NTM 9 [Spatholobus suberectus]|nr:NTM 9 [Spatholobus suberectus]
MQSTVPRILDYVPVGFGFRPTDEELVDYYLRKKLLDDNPRVHVMPVIDLCDVEPWEVPVMFAESTIRFREPDKFFFSPVDYKYSNSKRFNRTTKCGFWKATGKDLDIRTWDTNTVIGTKKTLVFYKGSVSCGVKSNWVIHEYHAAPATFPESQVGLFFLEVLTFFGNNLSTRFFVTTACTFYFLGFDVISYAVGCSDFRMLLEPLFDCHTIFMTQFSRPCLA